MFSKVRFFIAGTALAGALALTGCGGGGAGGGVNVTAGDALAFDQTTLTMPAAGGTVSFRNNSSGLQHNWVLARGGDDVAAQIDQAAAADPTDYVPDGDPNIVAATGLLNGGQSGTATVPALTAGSYTYLCTFPGHYAAGMKGVLTVQ